MKKRYLSEVADLFKVISKLPGWLDKRISVQEQFKLIRESLGMTQKQLAKRVGLKQNAIAMFERDGHTDFQISTLEKLAKGLHARVVVNIVPLENLEKMVERRAEGVAEKIFKITTGSTAIEKQLPSKKYRARQLKELRSKILGRHKGILWEED